jgi:hypothetical protein
MRTQRITDQQATALLRGRVPQGRDDLEPLSAMVGALRLSSFDAPPQPSAHLAARLDLDRLNWLSASAPGAGAPGCRDLEIAPAVRAGIRKRTLVGWFAGLGVAAQLVLGAGAVTASAAGIGMAGALPPVAQQLFDEAAAAVADTGTLLGLVPEQAPAPVGGTPDVAHRDVTEHADQSDSGSQTVDPEAGEDALHDVDQTSSASDGAGNGDEPESAVSEDKTTQDNASRDKAPKDKAPKDKSGNADKESRGNGKSDTETRAGTPDSGSAAGKQGGGAAEPGDAADDAPGNGAPAKEAADKVAKGDGLAKTSKKSSGDPYP